MERRTHESPMDWEYQNQGPMDPTSPFVRSMQSAQKSNTSFGAARPGALPTSNPNPFNRTQSSPNKPLSQPPNLFGASSSAAAPAASHPLFPRTNTAPPFRNPAFTTPRKSYDMDAVSEMSAAEDSPSAVTDVSDFLDPDTPDDNSRFLKSMNMTPARSKALQVIRKSPGKGEIASTRTMFSTRDKIRKRKKRHDDKDISGYRLPYKHVNEWDESEEDPDTDDSTYEPNERDQSRGRRGKGKAPTNKGWFTNFLSTIQKHPTAPHILGYWLTLLFNASLLGFALWVITCIIQAFRHEMYLISQNERSSILDDMAKCAMQYTDNRCSPREKRLPAIAKMCEEWEICMNQNPDQIYQVRFGARNVVEICNNIFETMHWKTMAAFFILILILCMSGVSLMKTTAPPNFTTAVPQPSQPANPQHYFYQMKPPRTPHRSAYGFLQHQDETPDTDASPDVRQMLPPPYETPGGRRRSPSKELRGRSPTKSRSPMKRY